MSVAFRLVPAPQLGETAHVDPIRLLELRTQTQAVIESIDRMLRSAQIRRIERRSTAAAQQRPVGVPIEYHCAGRVLGIR